MKKYIILALLLLCGVLSAQAQTKTLNGQTSSQVAAFVGPSITQTGTIATGVWNGTVIGATYGGTGINNGANTISLGGSLATSGAFPLTLTTTASTNVTTILRTERQQ